MDTINNNDDDDPDPWIARDKLYHVLFCLILTLFFSTLATYTRYPFLRTHSIRVGSILSLLAGATKEAAYHLGIFPSPGASFKDAVFDVVSVLIASWALYLWRKFSDRPGGD